MVCGRGLCEGYHTINKPIQHSIAFVLLHSVPILRGNRTKTVLNRTALGAGNFISSDWKIRNGGERRHIILV